MGSRKRRLAFGALAFVAYLALAVVATYPLARKAHDHVFGLGTPPLNVWAMAWVQHQLPRDPLHLFDGNAFYPYSDTLAFSEHLFVPALLGAPVALASGDNYVLTHNVVVLLTFALAGLGMYLLAFEVCAHRPAAFAAGVLYAFHSWNVNEVIRLQILSNQWFPFLLWMLLRYFERPSPRRAAAAGLFYALQALSCMYWALYAPLLTLLVLAGLQWRRRLTPRQLAPLALGLGLGFLVSAPFLLPYMEGARQWGFSRGLPGSIGMIRYLSVMPGSVLYRGWLPRAQPNADAAHFLGFAAMLLGGVGLLLGRPRPGSPLTRGLLGVLVVTGFLLSLGPLLQTGYGTLGPGPYRLLYEYVPGFRNVRYPERFALFVTLGLAPLVALGLARLSPRRSWPALVASGLIFVEHLAIPLTLAPLPTGAQIPEVYRWLTRQDDVQVVAEVPGGRYLNERADALPMYLSTVHWKRTLQGFTGYFPPAHNFVRWRLHHFPAPESRAFLEGLGVDTLLVRAPGDGACRDAAWTRVSGPLDDVACVLRLAPGKRLLAPPAEDQTAPALVEVDRRQWKAAGTRPHPERAIDGDAQTFWTTGREQERGDSYRLTFGASVEVARLVIDVPPPFEFPLSLRLIGETPDGQRVDLTFDRAAAYDRLFQLLLRRPREAALILDVPATRLTSLTLRMDEDDDFDLPWTMAEVRVFTRRGGAHEAP